jgi:uncharacterized protein
MRLLIRLVNASVFALWLGCNATWAAADAIPPGPSYSCANVVAGSIEAMVCNDAGLSALDRKLAAVYGEALKAAVAQQPPTLRADQRGWIKGRDECAKNDPPRACVENEYRRRIAELQAIYRLLPVSASATYVCNGKQTDEVVASYFATDPPTLVAERGDSVSLMFLQPSASGSKYAGRNETLWEHAGDTKITWGHGAAAMSCIKRN